jgi:2-hydroxy-3-oxopropionate reductase
MNTQQIPRIGFIGLGIMGGPMACNLRKGGYAVTGFSRSGVPQACLDAGVVPAASPAAVAAASEVVIVMVPDTPDVERVLFGPGGVAEAVKPGTVVINMSSISPAAEPANAARLAERGAEYIDAPVSGGDVGAIAGTLSIMAGGKPEVFEAVRPVLACMGKALNHIGPHGAGQTCKLANNMVGAMTLMAVAEALTFASKAGADPAKVREALLGGFAQSRILEIHGKRMIERDFAPGFKIELMQKDLNNALQNARQLGMAIQGTATAHQLFNVAMGLGGAQWDHSGIARAIEAMASHAITTD